VKRPSAWRIGARSLIDPAERRSQNARLAGGQDGHEQPVDAFRVDWPRLSEGGPAGWRDDRHRASAVGLEPLAFDEASIVRELVQEHERRTGSQLAGRILDDWQRTQLRFVKVMPHDYRAAIERHRDQPVSAGGHGLFTRESETEEAA